MSRRQLGLTYTEIRVAFAEAIDYYMKASESGLADQVRVAHEAEAAAQLSAGRRLLCGWAK